MITSFVANHLPFWAWRLLWTVSPWHRGYEAGRREGLAAGRIIDRMERLER